MKKKKEKRTLWKNSLKTDHLSSNCILFQLNVSTNKKVILLLSLQCFCKYGYLEILNMQLEENTELYQGERGRLYL